MSKYYLCSEHQEPCCVECVQGIHAEVDKWKALAEKLVSALKEFGGHADCHNTEIACLVCKAIKSYDEAVKR